MLDPLLIIARIRFLLARKNDETSVIDFQYTKDVMMLPDSNLVRIASKFTLDSLEAKCKQSR